MASTVRLALLVVAALSPLPAAARPTAPPAQMRSLRTKTSKGCGPPYACVELVTAATPTPKHGEALIRILSTSVNPSDVVLVEAQCVHTSGPGRAVHGTAAHLHTEPDERHHRHLPSVSPTS